MKDPEREYQEKLEELDETEVGYLAVLYEDFEGKDDPETVLHELSDSDFKDKYPTTTIRSALSSCVPGEITQDQARVVMEALNEIYSDELLQNSVEKLDTRKDQDPDWRIDYELDDFFRDALNTYIESSYSSEESKEPSFLVKLEESVEEAQADIADELQAVADDNQRSDGGSDAVDLEEFEVDGNAPHLEGRRGFGSEL